MGGKKMDNIVEFKNITFKYDEDKTLLSSLTFSILKGKYTVLLGHNGSGKSTIAKLIIGLLEAQSGEIIIDGKVLSEQTVDEIRSHVAIVFQNPDNQFIGSTVEDDIAFGLENRCVRQEDMQSIIDEFAFKVGMSDFLKAEPTSLSGGQKQRVAIAGALALHPDLLILDEATSMLDPKGKKEIMKVINDIKKDNPSMSILSITHHIDEALSADQIIILNDGKIAAIGNPKEILFNQNLLEQNALLPPFVVEARKKLQEKGILIDECFTMEELVSKL